MKNNNIEESILKFKQASGTGCFVCSTGTEGRPITILYRLDVEHDLRLKKVVDENEIAMAAIAIADVLCFESNTEDGLPPAWPNEFEHRKNYEIEDEDWFDTDDEGWFGIEYAQLHVYQTRWEVAVFIDNNTVLFNDSTNFEIT